jgi:hypothetical protein
VKRTELEFKVFIDYSAKKGCRKIVKGRTKQKMENGFTTESLKRINRRSSYDGPVALSRQLRRQKQSKFAKFQVKSKGALKMRKVMVMGLVSSDDILYAE